MNKKDIMRQPSMEALIPALIRSKPGITSARLFEVAKEWAGCSEEAGQAAVAKQAGEVRLWTVQDTWEFEGILAGLIADGWICTNKQWQEKGYMEPRSPKGPPKVCPRQLRMDW
jgi:hypothetical protein